MVNSATPSANERVPSIGSTTQTRRRSQPDPVVLGLLREPAVGGVVAAQLGVQEPVDRDVGLGDDLARSLVPALVLLAEEPHGDPAGLDHGGARHGRPRRRRSCAGHGQAVDPHRRCSRSCRDGSVRHQARRCTAQRRLLQHWRSRDRRRRARHARRQQASPAAAPQAPPVAWRVRVATASTIARAPASGPAGLPGRWCIGWAHRQTAHADWELSRWRRGWPRCGELDDGSDMPLSQGAGGRWRSPCSAGEVGSRGGEPG